MFLPFTGFRPLDGESISKRGEFSISMPDSVSFRPLDGESISKRWVSTLPTEYIENVSVP